MARDIIKKISELLIHIEDNNDLKNVVHSLEGFSGKKIIATLQGITKILCEDSVYLEIGVFRGLTLLSNAFENKKVPCCGIDNFSLFDAERNNRRIIETNINQLGLSNVNIIDRDYEDALGSLTDYIGAKKVGVFFVDGPHDYRSQLVSLLWIVPHLADNCAIIIDDANYSHVRQATNDFLRTFPDFALIAEAYTPKHPANMNDEEKRNALNGWWNGINIIVRDPERLISRKLAKEDNKKLHFASHDIFRHEFADVAFDIMRLAQLAKFDELKKLIAKHKSDYPEFFEHQNTFSDSLTRFVVYS